LIVGYPVDDAIVKLCALPGATSCDVYDECQLFDVVILTLYCCSSPRRHCPTNVIRVLSRQKHHHLINWM